MGFLVLLKQNVEKDTYERKVSYGWFIAIFLARLDILANDDLLRDTYWGYSCTINEVVITDIKVVKETAISWGYRSIYFTAMFDRWNKVGVSSSSLTLKQT